MQSACIRGIGDDSGDVPFAAPAVASRVKRRRRESYRARLCVHGCERHRLLIEFLSPPDAAFATGETIDAGKGNRRRSSSSVRRAEASAFTAAGG